MIQLRRKGTTLPDLDLEVIKWHEDGRPARALVLNGAWTFVSDGVEFWPEERPDFHTSWDNYEVINGSA